MNRRSFFKTITGFAVGVYAAFAPGKAEGELGTIDGVRFIANGTDKVKKWHQPQPQVEPLTENMAPPKLGWSMTYETRIFNDSNVTVITGPEEELKGLYEALKEGEIKSELIN